ncbi:MAG: protein translocase subunit SecD, partial [Pseudomonadota bacterium]|nr:protein translocase subunit SecD [Pseudomonadota bacterium]
MLNKYPLWKYLLILLVIALGVVYALPNLYPDDPALQLSTQKTTTVVDQRTLTTAETALKNAGITLKEAELTSAGGTLRFNNGEDQLAAKPVIAAALGEIYVGALNLVPTTPEWLSSIGAGPAKLGLDLRGGVHFLLEVDTPAALKQRLDVAASEMKNSLRTERIRYRSVEVTNGVMSIRFLREEDQQAALELLQDEFSEYVYNTSNQGSDYF